MNKKIGNSGLTWRFTDKRFTPWGGMRIFEELLRRLNWDQALQSAQLPQPGSNRGLDPVIMVKGFLLTVWTGGGRFAHTASVRFDFQPLFSPVWPQEKRGSFQAFVGLDVGTSGGAQLDGGFGFQRAYPLRSSRGQ
jgi:hypothetical protein